MEGSNVGTINGKSPKQGLTSAKGLTLDQCQSKVEMLRPG